MRTIAVILIALMTAPADLFAREAAPAAQNVPNPKRYDYSGAGVPDAEMVQRVVATLGVGKTVDLTTTGSKKLRAKIRSIHASGFTVTHGRTPVPMTVAYDEVTQLKPTGWPIGAKVALGAGAVVGGSILLWLATIMTCECG